MQTKAISLLLPASSQVFLVFPLPLLLIVALTYWSNFEFFSVYSFLSPENKFTENLSHNSGMDNRIRKSLVICLRGFAKKYDARKFPARNQACIILVTRIFPRFSRLSRAVRARFPFAYYLVWFQLDGFFYRRVINLFCACLFILIKMYTSTYKFWETHNLAAS